jgi:two-component system sensor kinase FixL
MLVQSDAALRNVRVVLDVSPDLPQVRGDRIQLQQVLLNLLLNAFDAMKDCPGDEREVLLRAEPDGAGLVRTSVSDLGPGLTSDKLDRIFQPFFSTKREGLGVGLSISRSIIEAHGGKLWAENNNGRGATFCFTVPIEESVAGRGSGVGG